jgi:ATP-dependent DNA helicase RecG
MPPSEPGTGQARSPARGRTLGFLASTPVDVLRKVGPAKKSALRAIGIESVLDLLTHYPYRYQDKTRLATLAELSPGDEAWVSVEVLAAAKRRTRNGRVVVEAEVFDPTGRLHLTFFNQPWRARQLASGSKVMLFGRLDTFRGRRSLVNPEVEQLGEEVDRIVPLYPSSERAGIDSADIARLVAEALERAGPFADPLPESLIGRLRLCSRTEAFRWVHQPPSLEEANRAKRRLAFDELLRLELEALMRRRVAEHLSRGISHPRLLPGRRDLVEEFLANLPFAPTGAQLSAIAEIREDLESPRPMHRLLQGDVGSGKTVVALAALVAGIQGGFQGALMAPTEVLAEQHYLSVRSLVGELSVPDVATLEGERPFRVALLTNRVGAAERRRTLEGLAAGRIDLVVGTHALLGAEVRFRRLGVVVIDEQHRFGVDQRAALWAKGQEAGADPDLLVMTATPIPRTAAMVVFGDLDVTVMDEFPPGRAPVETVWARDEVMEEAAWAKVREQVGKNRRAYVVCPLVEGSERTEARSVTEEAERLAAGPLGGIPLGVMHGRLDASEKQSVMDAFRRGELPVLVATTVIEVGVDVPEATVMVVQDAQRFGLAQLHQLRGRVGRSELPSWCYLLGTADSKEAMARLEAMVATRDGFELAEVDLELRGAGTILGSRQQGRSDLKLARLNRRWHAVVAKARAVASEILASDPLLEEHWLLGEEVRLFVGDDEASYLLRS